MADRAHDKTQKLSSKENLKRFVLKPKQERFDRKWKRSVALSSLYSVPYISRAELTELLGEHSRVPTTFWDELKGKAIGPGELFDCAIRSLDRSAMLAEAVVVERRAFGRQMQLTEQMIDQTQAQTSRHLERLVRG